MRLTKIQIENFRSFENETINFDNYTCFVGPNGAGKSTVLTALNIFFRNNAGTSTNIHNLNNEDFHHRNTNKPIKITLTFDKLSNNAQKDFKHYYRQGKLTVIAKAVWNSNSESAPVEQYGVRSVMDEFKEYFEAVEKKENADRLKNIYKKIQAEHPNFNLPNANTKPSMEESLHSFEEAHEELCKPSEATTQFYGWTKGSNILEKYIQWIYVPAVKDASTEQEEGAKTALGQLLNRTIRAKVDFSKSISALKKEVVAQYSDIIKNEKEILKSLKDSLEYKLRTWANPGANLDLIWHYDDDKSIRIEEPVARVTIGEGSFIGEIARLGHGMQRAFLLSILQELAESDQENRPKLLLGVEEPELYQHPPQAQHMATILEDMGEDNRKNSQIIVTTHSPYFVTYEKFPSIRMVRKKQNQKISQIKGTTYEKIAAHLTKTLTPNPTFANSLMANISQIMNPSQNELFFTSLAILVEGREDVAYISTQFELSGSLDEFKKLGCHFIVTDGKNNMNRFLAISKELDISTFVVFDSDYETRQKELEAATKDTEVYKQAKLSFNKTSEINLEILQLCSILDCKPMPESAFFGTNVVMWSDEIRSAVIKDIGESYWVTAENSVKKRLGLDGVKAKNKMLIAVTLKELHEQSKQSASLIKLCGAILRHATKVQNACS